jgi:hypothetical protein
MRFDVFESQGFAVLAPCPFKRGVKLFLLARMHEKSVLQLEPQMRA